MHHCPNCGADVEDSWKACPRCGTVLRGAYAGISPTATAPRQTYSKPSPPTDFGSPSKNPNVLLGLLSFIIPIVGLILGAIFVSKSRSDDKYTGKLCFGLAVAGIVLFTVLLIVCAVEVGETIFSVKDVEVVDCKIESRTMGFKYIVGTAKNNSDHEYSYLMIEFNLYDDEGRLLHNTFDSIENLEPNEVWRFEVPIFEEDATRVEVENISGF